MQDIVIFGTTVIDIYYCMADRDLNRIANEVNLENFASGRSLRLDLGRHDAFTQCVQNLCLEPVYMHSGDCGSNVAASMAKLYMDRNSDPQNIRFITPVSGDKNARLACDLMQKYNIDMRAPKAANKSSTLLCYTICTNDQSVQRTFMTHNPSSVEPILDIKYIKQIDFSNFKIAVLPLYFFLPCWDSMKESVQYLVSRIRQRQCKIAFFLSTDYFLKGDKRDIVDWMIDISDILFFNTSEICTYLDLSTFDINKVASLLQDHFYETKEKLFVITADADGAFCVKISGKDLKIEYTPSHHIENIVDVNGAGDAFAAGFLYGILQELECSQSLALGAKAASEIITQYGAKPQAKNLTPQAV